QALQALNRKLGGDDSDLLKSRAEEESELLLNRFRPVRPEVVLCSAELTKWCQDQRKELDSWKSEYKIFDPQRSNYGRALSNLEHATAGFREGSALQRNIVISVLDHGMLERLDEHLLGLWEVAQALDPKET